MTATTRPASWDRDTVLTGGAWRPVATTLPVENPATEEIIGHAASAGPADVDAAVAAAVAAGTRWGATCGAERVAVLTALHAELTARRDELVEVTVAEVGAPVRVAREAHIDLALDVLASFARLAGELALEEACGSSLVLRRPAGVVACITPWNYPLYQLVAKVGAALAAGCTTVVKPAELAPLSTYLFGDAVLAAGVPAGAVNIVPGPGRTVGAALVAHPGVDVVSFTGSTAVGRQVAAVAAGALKRACLELGGKSASVVLEDADLPAAVEATVGSALLNSGQTCSAWTRLLVPEHRLPEAEKLAAVAAEALMVGDPRAESTDLGPLISAGQRASVLQAVDGAVRRGATVLTGGTNRPAGLTRGHYVAPTVLSGVGADDPICRDEVFGPVLVVLGCTDEDDAVAVANDSPYGLAGAVWSGDPERALAVARRMQTGQVDINGAPFNPEAPFGGWKASGLGRELGRTGVDEFTELTAVQR